MAASALVMQGQIICSRDGEPMTPELLWSKDNGDVPFLLWRCQAGHITQAVPIPPDLRATLDAGPSFT